MSINIGSTLGFLICSWLGEKIGWHWGFGAAGNWNDIWRYTIYQT